MNSPSRRRRTKGYRTKSRLTAGVSRKRLGRQPRPINQKQEEAAGMRDTHIAGVSLGGILVIAGIVLAILLGHWWIGLIIILVGLVFFGGFAKGKWY
jgi:hypothetical protein